MIYIKQGSVSLAVTTIKNTPLDSCCV